MYPERDGEREAIVTRKAARAGGRARSDAPDDRGAVDPAACCPLPPGVAPLPIAAPAKDDASLDLAAVGKALSDPIRLRMLALMTEAARCCRPRAASAEGHEARAADPEGVCVCELQGLYGLAQSKVSYHLKVLRAASLIRETKRGRWSFYTVDAEAARRALDAFGARLGV